MADMPDEWVTEKMRAFCRDNGVPSTYASRLFWKLLLCALAVVIGGDYSVVKWGAGIFGAYALLTAGYAAGRWQGYQDGLTGGYSTAILGRYGVTPKEHRQFWDSYVEAVRDERWGRR